MVAEILDLLNLLKGLVNSKAELDSKYFDNFIKPVWESFEKTHKNYKTTFEEYYEMVTKDDFHLKSLLRKIERDDLLSEDLRGELGSMVNNLPPSRMKAKYEIMAEYINAIKDYFDYQDFLNNSAFEKDSNKLVFRSGDVQYELQDRPSGIRDIFPFIAYIARDVFSEYLTENKNLSKPNIQKTIKYITQEIQNRYVRVANAYQALKRELLT